MEAGNRPRTLTRYAAVGRRVPFGSPSTTTPPRRLRAVLLDARPDDKGVCQRIVRSAKGIDNETSIHTALLLYKARALRRLGLLDAARQTLTYALRRKKGRSDELRQALRYERALVYEDLGRRGRARSELEKLYAEDPDYEDVAARLGL